MASESKRTAVLSNPRYPRSAKYDPQWILGNHMGSHCLWLTEALAAHMSLKPGMRVLDLGCGKALGSIFLAKEFGVQVCAFDLKIDATANWKRVREGGVQDTVFPLQGNALEMPFADDFFDAVISVNSIWDYGTGGDFMDAQLARVVKPGGQIGCTVPGFLRELNAPPAYLKPHWHPDFNRYHSPKWWRGLWGRAESIDIDLIDAFENGEGAKLWRDFTEALGGDKTLEADNGRNLTFLRLIATKC
jgi:SAM-dependent methyltransferase